MNSSSDTPMYNLKAVVQETGLKPDTLRAWERRYGLPDPQRTESGHRLYSQNDINMLKWLSTRQDEGMSISRAVELWRSLQTTQENASQAHPSAGLRTSSLPTAMASPTTMNQGSILAEAREAWVASCIAFDEQHAEQIISQACAIFSVETVCLEIIQQGLAKIGENWYKGKITVQQEHFASALAIRRMEALLAATPTPTRPGRILVGCPSEEVHTFAPLLLSLLLRRRGWDILFLGGNVPMQNMLLTVQTAKPILVILTAQQLYTAANLYEMAQMLYKERIPLAFGGKVFSEIPDLPQRIAGHYLGDRLEEATQAVEQVMALPRPQPAAKTVPPAYQAAAAQFRARQPRIEAEVWRSMGKAEIPHEDLGKANLHFSRNIIAALTLGDIDYVGVDIVWIKGLLSNHYQLPEHLIDDYLKAYLDAIEIHLEHEQTIVTKWLRGILTKGIPNFEDVKSPGPKKQRRSLP
ncbi:MAG: MerR family transcriptional regulator [Chloroflexi bacterium]|nr:MerR family transcriptional regulator [Chloroflexota bacterium]